MWIQSTALPHFYCLIYTSSNHIRCRLVEICEERKAYVKNESKTLVFSTLAECHYFFKRMIPAQRLNFKARCVCSSEGKFSHAIILWRVKIYFQFSYKGAFIEKKSRQSCNRGESKTSQTSKPLEYHLKTELHAVM